jgi:hypothetical protein
MLGLARLRPASPLLPESEYAKGSGYPNAWSRSAGNGPDHFRLPLSLLLISYQLKLE